MSKRIETKGLHSGYVTEATSRSLGVPVYRTNAFEFKSTEQAADLFALKESGNIYTRLNNSTITFLEDRMTDMEGGAAAVAFASGTAAIHNAIINICSAGDEIVASRSLYGGTFTMLNNILPQFGITTRFVDVNNPEQFAESINEKTRLLYTETIGNPTLDTADIGKIAGIAHAAKLPLFVDATFTSPALLKPIDFGADIVIHSLSKWINGHGTGIGGIVIDSGRFDWSAGNFPLLNEPDNSYGGIRWTKDIGELIPTAYAVRLRTVPLRNLGACLAPDNAWFFLQGLETLSLRMKQHSENALEVARYLKNNDKVAWVRYPGLTDDPSYETASRYLDKGFGGMVVFAVKGGRDAGASVINKMKIFRHVANVGDAKSLAIHPASTTHLQLTPEQQKAAGIDPGLIRLSVGLESIDDILEDLTQAMS